MEGQEWWEEQKMNVGREGKEAGRETKKMTWPNLCAMVYSLMWRHVGRLHQDEPPKLCVCSRCQVVVRNARRHSTKKIKAIQCCKINSSSNKLLMYQILTIFTHTASKPVCSLYQIFLLWLYLVNLKAFKLWWSRAMSHHQAWNLTVKSCHYQC